MIREYWKTLALIVTMFALTLALMAATSGCAGWDGTLMRWAPTEAQKQSADLVVQDLQTLRGHVTPVAEATRAEAERASRITQAYVGLPETPLEPVPLVVDPPKDPVKEEVLVDAEKAATKPPPTVTDMAATGFSLLEMALGAVGLGGAAVGVRKIRKGYKRAKQNESDLREARVRGNECNQEYQIRTGGLKIEVDAQRSAVDELVGTIGAIRTAAQVATDNYNPESGDHGKALEDAITSILGLQSFNTKKIVSKARLNAGRKQGDV